MTRADRIAAILAFLACIPAALAIRDWQASHAPTPTPSRLAPVSPRPALDAASLAVRARTDRLLVEQIAMDPSGRVRFAVSGAETDIRRFALALETGQPAIRFTGWSLSALEGGAVRLEAVATPAERPARIAATDPRPLFGTATPPTAAPDAPVLAGIVGRLPNDAVALLRGDDGRAVTIAPGQAAPGGWRLESLSADAAIFTRGGERARVPLPAAE